MADRTRRGPTKSVLKWVKQFTDPKFNPERRTAMQMLAAAPVAGKLNLAQGALSQLDPVQFYKGYLDHMGGGDPLWWDFGKHQGMTSRLKDFLDRVGDLKPLWDEPIRYSDLAYGEQTRALDMALDEFHNTDPEDMAEPFFADEADLAKWRELHARYKEAHENFLGAEGDLDDDSPWAEKYYELQNELAQHYPEDQLVGDFAGDDWYSEYTSVGDLGDLMKYVEDNAAQYGLTPDELMKKLHLEKTLGQIEQLADVGSYQDMTHVYREIPDYWYQDPEALRYASMRQMLDNPVLSPNQMLEVTGLKGELEKGLMSLTPDDLAKDIHSRGYFDDRMADLDLERMAPSVRDKFTALLEDDATGYLRKLVENKYPEHTPLSSIPSYITNRSSVFRPTPRQTKRFDVREPLDYMDVIKALPPEEYSGGGRVG